MTYDTPPETEPVESYMRELDMLKKELAEAHALNRSLSRELKKAKEAFDEATRAHAKMVATLTETMRENTALTIERDAWKYRAQKHAQDSVLHGGDITEVLGIQDITEAEAKSIRKAMARLHHPDSGGDSDRMKAWNAMLDQIEYHR